MFSAAWGGTNGATYHVNITYMLITPENVSQAQISLTVNCCPLVLDPGGFVMSANCQGGLDGPVRDLSRRKMRVRLGIELCRGFASLLLPTLS
jgi:hypothetical protein